jgi:hypothetical protein
MKLALIAWIFTIGFCNLAWADYEILPSQQKQIYVVEISRENLLASCFKAYETGVVCLPFKDFKRAGVLMSWNFLSDFTDYNGITIDGLTFLTTANLSGLNFRSGGTLDDQKIQSFQIKIDDNTGSERLTLERAKVALINLLDQFEVRKLRVIVAE